jgi:alpha-glucoside transport system substrate-binding protein
VQLFRSDGGRAWKGLVATVAVSTLMVACGGGGNASTKPSTATTSSAPASLGTTTSQAPASLGGGTTSQAPTSPNGGSSQPSTGTGGTGTLDVLSLWGGSEEQAFKNVLADFTQKTGIQVNYEGVRTDYATVLQGRLTANNPPDIAIIPGIGFLRSFAKAGSLMKISDLGVDTSALASSYPEGFLAAGTVNDTLYAIPAKYNSKGTMWYRPDLYTAAGITVGDKPTWDDFKGYLDATKSKPGALGLGAKDDWTLTDWFENVYLQMNGTAGYDKLFSADGDWSDPTVQAAVDKMKEVLNDTYVVGGVTAALGRAWTDGIAQVFGKTPTAATYYEGGFTGGIAIGQTNTDLKIGDTINWYPFPHIGTDDLATFGGDVLGAFTNTDASKAFVQYLVTPGANTVWASTGAIVSPNKAVTSYPNDLVTREAQQLNSYTIRYDGSDLLPAGISGAGLGAELQTAIQGQTVDWADFQTRVKTAWDNE